MTPDDLTAPDRPEDLNPPEPNEALRKQTLRILDAADTVGLTVRSMSSGHYSWFLHGTAADGVPIGQARALADALGEDARFERSTTSDRLDMLNIGLTRTANLTVWIEKQILEADREAAALTIGRLAGWKTAPDWMDPAVVALAYGAALERVTSPDQLLELGGAARCLGVAA